MADAVRMLSLSEFQDVFSLFYILPTIFHSDLDRGFSIIDYGLNTELVSRDDLEKLHKLDIQFKFDLVLNHLSVGSPQFQDLIKRGDESAFKDFFIDWNKFWQGHGEMGPEGYVIPERKYLDKLFMRKPGLPILMVRFPDGTDRPYWNTFYQALVYERVTASMLLQALEEEHLASEGAKYIARIVNDALSEKRDLHEIDLGRYAQYKDRVVFAVEKNRKYLGQMDLNAESQSVWDFYDATLKKLRGHGGKVVRLDAFAYLHKEPGKSNFFNEPGTWRYLSRVKKLADKHDLMVLPEIHSVYGDRTHEKMAANGYPIYDFFFPGLVIHALDSGNNRYLLRWINELLDKDIRTINMLGCHDGIPVLDLKGSKSGEGNTEGLLADEEIEAVVKAIMDRGGRVKDLYGPDGKKIAYYQVNATFFSALGEDEQKMLLARAIQMFMPGTPQVWYLDLFAGKNNYAAADRGGPAAHKEINRTTLLMTNIEHGLSRPVVLDQLDLIRLRNTSPAFEGALTIGRSEDHSLQLSWENQGCTALLKADLRDHSFSVTHSGESGEQVCQSYPVDREGAGGLGVEAQ